MLAVGDDEIRRRRRTGWRDIVGQVTPVADVVSCKRLVPAARDRAPDIRPYERNPGVGLRSGSVQIFHCRIQPDLDEDTAGRTWFSVVGNEVEVAFFRWAQQRRELPGLVRTVVLQLDGNILTVDVRNPEIDNRIVVWPFPTSLWVAGTKVGIQRILRADLRSPLSSCVQTTTSLPAGSERILQWEK